MGRSEIKPNIESVQVGTVFNNYRAMCETLGLPVQTGNGKIYQLENLKRYIDFEQIAGTNKYTIKKIYEVPSPKKIREGSIFSKCIEYLLIAKLASQNGTECTATRSRLYEWLYMVNDNYKSIRANTQWNAINTSKSKKIDETAKQEQGRKNMLNDIFYGSVGAQISRTLSNALNSMINRCLIYVEEETIIAERFEDDFGNATYYYRKANFAECDTITKVKYNTLKQFNCQDIGAIIYRGLANQFFSKVCTVYRNEYGWDKVFSQIRIGFTPSTMAYESMRVGKTLQELYDEIAATGAKLNGELVAKMTSDGFFKKMGEGAGSPFSPEDREYLRSLVHERVKIDNVDPELKLVGQIDRNDQLQIPVIDMYGFGDILPVLSDLMPE